MANLKQSKRQFTFETLENRRLLAGAVTGHVHLDTEVNVPGVGLIEIERYSFSAVRHKDGRVSGEWQVHDVAKNGGHEIIHGDVTCFRIDPDGKTVYLGGIVERENLLGVPVGSEANWTIVDNGQGKKADPDLATDLTFGFRPGSNRASNYCRNGGGFNVIPLREIDGGNVNVNVKALLASPTVNDHDHVTGSNPLPITHQTVAVSDATEQQFQRIGAAINQLNRSLGTTALSLAYPGGPVADIQVSHAAASGCGTTGDGVLGCAHDDGRITILQGWDYYTGDTTALIQPNQYDYQTVITHELAHSVGIGHFDGLGAVMSPTLAAGRAVRVSDSVLHDAFFDSLPSLDRGGDQPQNHVLSSSMINQDLDEELPTDDATLGRGIPLMPTPERLEQPRTPKRVAENVEDNEDGDGWALELDLLLQTEQD